MQAGILKSFANLMRGKSTKKLFIHAGTYKTGTTYFQHMMYSNRHQLRDHHVLYPEIGIGLRTGHNIYAHRLLGINIAMGRSNLFPEIIKELNAPDNNYQSALVSYEGFSHPFNIDKLQEQEASLNGAEINAILVFRPHVDYAISLYRELCQHLGFRMPFNKFVSNDGGLYWQQALNYREIVEKWRNIAGKRRVHLLSYKRNQQDISNGILDVLGLQLELSKPKQIERNPSLSAPSAELMRRLNRLSFRRVDQHSIASELAKVDDEVPELQHYAELSEKAARNLEARYLKDRLFIEKTSQVRSKDLSISDRWRWGTKTAIQPLIPELHTKLVDQLNSSNKGALANLVKSADISP